MPVTITAGAVVITPDLVLGHQDEIVGGSIVHPIIGRTNPDVTLRAAAAPTGTLKLFFLESAAAQAARNAHLVGAVFSVTAPSQPWLPEQYVMRKLSRIQQDDRARWVLEVGYQELLP